MIYVLLLYAIFALTFPLIKLCMAQTTALFLIALRMILAGIILLGYQFIFQRKQFKLAQKDYWLFFKATFFMIFVAFVPDAYSLKYLTSIKGNLLWSSQPFISALLAYVLLHEKLGRKKIAGLLFGVIGTIVVLMAQEAGAASVSWRELFKIGIPELAVLLSAASTAYGWFIVKEIMDRKYPMVMINGITMLGGGLMSLLVYLIDTGIKVPCYTGSFMTLLGYTLILIFGSNIVAYNLYGILLKKYSITFLTFAGFICPIFGAIFGYLFFGEVMTWHYGIALLLIMIGLYLFHAEEVEKGNDQSFP